MKLCALASLIGFLAGAVLALLTGCETIENEDGSKTTRFDSAAFDSAVKTGGALYDRYERSRPTYQQPLVAPDGTVIYPNSP